jgi:hypothetical protein
VASNSYISLLLWRKCSLRSQFIDQNAIFEILAIISVSVIRWSKRSRHVSRRFDDYNKGPKLTITSNTTSKSERAACMIANIEIGSARYCMNAADMRV